MKRTTSGVFAAVLVVCALPVAAVQQGNSERVLTNEEISVLRGHCGADPEVVGAANG